MKRYNPHIPALALAVLPFVVHLLYTGEPDCLSYIFGLCMVYSICTAIDKGIMALRRTFYSLSGACALVCLGSFICWKTGAPLVVEAFWMVAVWMIVHICICSFALVLLEASNSAVIAICSGYKVARQCVANVRHTLFVMFVVLAVLSLELPGLTGRYLNVFLVAVLTVSELVHLLKHLDRIRRIRRIFGKDVDVFAMPETYWAAKKGGTHGAAGENDSDDGASGTSSVSGYAGRKDKIISDLSDSSTAPDYGRPRDTNMYTMEEIISRISVYMDEAKPYLDSSFNIDMMARAIPSNRGYISKCLNYKLKVNFCKFVNHYRVEYAKAEYRKNTSLKVADLALLSGFNNTVSFINAFKQETDGMTPGDWCIENRVAKMKESRQHKAGDGQ